MVAKKEDVQGQAKANLEKFKKAQEGFKNSVAELKETHTWLLAEIEELNELKKSVEEQLSEVGALDAEKDAEVPETDEQSADDEEPAKPLKTPSRPRKRAAKKDTEAVKEEKADENEEPLKEKPEDEAISKEDESAVEEETVKSDEDENLDDALGLLDAIDDKANEKAKNDSNEDDLDFLDF